MINGHRTRCSIVALLLLLSPAAAPAQPVPALDADERGVSTGSWLCSRYLDARAQNAGAAAADILASARQFALGYVHGAADAVGRPLEESAATDDRILALFDARCSEDSARAIRDASLLAGRSMLEQATPARPTIATASTATGRMSCRTYLELPATGSRSPGDAARVAVHNWVDGFINARFERAGRGLIPTARNKALTLDRFDLACAERPAGSTRMAALAVVDAMLPQK